MPIDSSLPRSTIKSLHQTAETTQLSVIICRAFHRRHRNAPGTRSSVGRRTCWPGSLGSLIKHHQILASPVPQALSLTYPPQTSPSPDLDVDLMMYLKGYPLLLLPERCARSDLPSSSAVRAGSHRASPKPCSARTAMMDIACVQ
jgi:hypothetical protein